MKFSIILPTYNEAPNIAPMVQAILRVIPDSIEVLVVDDNSPDGTWQVVQEMQASDSRVCLVRRAGNRGLANSLNEGLRHARGDYIAWMDADLSMPADLLPKMECALQEYDVCVASRFVKGGRNVGDSLLAEVSSLVLSWMARLTLRLGVRDITSGYIMARREVFQGVTLIGDYGEYFITLVYLLKMRGQRIVEIPCATRPRRAGESKTFPSLAIFVRQGFKYLRILWNLRKKATLH